MLKLSKYINEYEFESLMNEDLNINEGLLDKFKQWASKFFKWMFNTPKEEDESWSKSGGYRNNRENNNYKDKSFLDYIKDGIKKENKLVLKIQDLNTFKCLSSNLANDAYFNSTLKTIYDNKVIKELTNNSGKINKTYFGYYSAIKDDENNILVNKVFFLVLNVKDTQTNEANEVEELTGDNNQNNNQNKEQTQKEQILEVKFIYINYILQNNNEFSQLITDIFKDIRKDLSSYNLNNYIIDFTTLLNLNYPKEYYNKLVNILKGKNKDLKLKFE